MAAKPSLHTHVTLQTFMGHLVDVTHPKHYIPHSSPHTPYAHTPLPPAVNSTALNNPPPHTQPLSSWKPRTRSSPHTETVHKEKRSHNPHITPKCHTAHTPTLHITLTLNLPSHTSHTPDSPPQAQIHTSNYIQHTHHPDIETHPA